jgi:RDD family
MGWGYARYEVAPRVPRGIDPVTGLALATWGRRAWAYLIDFAVVVIPLAGIALGTGLAMARTIVRPDGSRITGDSGLGAFVIIVEIIVGSIVYFGVLNGLSGRTVGMRALHLEVRDASGVGLIGFWRAAGRFGILYAALLIPLIGYFVIGADLLSPLWDRRNQAWHDKIFSSIVLVRTGTTS